MSVATVRAVLIAAPAVTALVPANRIEALRRTQAIGIPGITLQRVVNTPFNDLRGWSDLDVDLVQLDVYDDSYTDALTIAAACRTALEAGRMQLQSETEVYEPETDPELYRVTQSWSVFT